MHWELAESLGVTDFERGAKVSGRMFYALGETGARLQRALVQWMIDLHREKHGYEERGDGRGRCGRPMSVILA